MAGAVRSRRSDGGRTTSGGTLLALTAPPDDALAKAHGVTASFVFHQSDAGRLERVVEAVLANRLTVLVDRRVALADVAAALRHQASGRARGKILITVDG